LGESDQIWQICLNLGKIKICIPKTSDPTAMIETFAEILTRLTSRALLL